MSVHIAGMPRHISVHKHTFNEDLLEVSNKDLFYRTAFMSPIGAVRLAATVTELPTR